MVKWTIIFCVSITALVANCSGSGIPEHLPDRLISVYREKKTWFGAYMECLRKGMKLIEISSESDNYDVVDVMAKHGEMEWEL